MADIRWQDWRPSGRDVRYSICETRLVRELDSAAEEAWDDVDIDAGQTPEWPVRVDVYAPICLCERDFREFAEGTAESWTEWWHENCCHEDDDDPQSGADAAALVPVLRAWAARGSATAYVPTGEIVLLDADYCAPGRGCSDG